uniref:Kinesin motor domain-containing protein n=1 Tax=Poecilia mexicana TaxID=48701 RepID=A0A3B3X3S8_9TELE
MGSFTGVKVMVRVCPTSQSDAAESSSFLKVDPRKKQITIMDPSANQTPNAASQKRAGVNHAPPKMFTFDAAFPPDASQAEVCAGTVAEVIQSVVNGADGCIFCFGHSKLGKSYTMIGRDDSLQTLGIIPCAISWLFKLINERKEKTGARFSVRVSAVEVWGKEENLKDLLSDVATGSLQDGQSPGVYLCEDPICGMQLQNQSELRAPTPEKAAWFLDAAITARHSSQRPSTTEEEHRNSHMLFTLHIYQYRMEKTGKGGMSGGRSRLHLLDLGSCDAKALGGGGGGKSRESSSPSSAPLCLSLSALGNVILALVNGSKHIPYKDSKLTMLLRESLGNMNCRTTMIAHISASPRDFSETLSTIQIASRVLRMKKKKTKYTSSSSGGESSCEEGRMRRPTHLRPFHHRGDADSELPLLRLSSDPDEYSSSEQSCDTVIYVGPNGAAVSDRELTDNEGPPEFVPIVPALRADKWPSAATEGAECLKCNTFAELQERLDCIDGSEEVTDASNHKKIQKKKKIRLILKQLFFSFLQVAKFPFEEIPTSKPSAKQESCPSSSAPGSADGLDAEPKTGNLTNVLRENLNAVGNIEGKARPLGSPRLGIASLTKTSDYRPPSSPSQRCKVYTQKGVMPSTPPPLAADSGRSSTESLLSRTSPAGMSPQVREPTASLSASLGSAETLCDDDVPPIPLDTHKDVTDGYDIVATGLVEDRSLVCRPVSIISFNSDCGSEAALALEPQPIGIIFTCYPSTFKLRTGETLATGMSNSGSPISSWMSDLSMCSEADRSLHSFSQSQSQQGEALADSEARQSFEVEVLDGCGSGGSSRRGSLEGELVLSEKASDKGTPNRDRQRKLPPSMAKTNIQILPGPGNVSPFKTTISVHPCMVVKPMIIHEPTILSSPIKTALMKDTGKAKAEILASISSEINFEDPWLKRGMEEGRPRELICEVKPEKREVEPLKSHGRDFCKDGKKQADIVLKSFSCGEVVSSLDSFKRVVDGCEMITVAVQGECLTGICSPDIHRTASLPRGWHRLNHHDGLESGTEYRNLGVTNSTPCSPRATLERLGSKGKQGLFSHKKGGIPPLPPVRKSSLDQRNRAASPLPQPTHGVSSLSSSTDNSGITRQRGSSIDSSRLFSAKLEQLANRTNSLGRVHGSHSGSHHYDCFSLERGESLRGAGGVRGDSTMPRTGRSITRTGSVSSPIGNPSSPSFSGGSSPNSAPQSPAKSSGHSKVSAVSKLLMTSGPKSRSLSASSTKTLSFSTKSLTQTSSRSSSLPPNGKQGSAPGSWSTQSLSRSRGGSLTAKLPLRAVNSRISELLQGSAGSRSREERAAVVQTLPSPYSKITAPRKPHRCSSGHASDNSSVLSGELPPAMGKTALFYHSGGSSGYESMLRDSSENTGSTSSAPDSLSEHSSATTSSRRSSKSSKKSRSNSGLQRRRLIPALTLDSSSSPGACWVDGPLGPPVSSNHRGVAASTETIEIKVYEIDDVERLQKRRDKGGSDIFFRAKYQCLKKELEQTKQHLMLEPHKWTAEFELQQPYDVDSVEYLEALETVTDKLETRVNFCKAHLMMITCFDVSSRHR